MKKRVFSLLLALAMLVSLLPTAIAADAITIPDVSEFTNTYANILDAGFPAQEILEAFPDSIETSYDAETEIFTMEDIGAGSASAYYRSYEMTLEDGVWSVPLSQEEYEGSVHVFKDEFGAWEAYYESDGRFRYVDGTAGRVYFYIDGYEVWIQYPHGELVVMDYYNLTDGAFYLQSVWRQIEEDDYCEVYYSADGALPSAYVSRGENLYFYENGEWTLDGAPCDPPEGFETEAEIKAACPFVAPIEVGEESDAPTVTHATLEGEGVTFDEEHNLYVIEEGNTRDLTLTYYGTNFENLTEDWWFYADGPICVKDSAWTVDTEADTATITISSAKFYWSGKELAYWDDGCKVWDTIKGLGIYVMNGENPHNVTVEIPSEAVEITDADVTPCEGASYDAEEGWTPKSSEEDGDDFFFIELQAGDLVYYELSDTVKQVSLYDWDTDAETYTYFAAGLPNVGYLEVEEDGNYNLYTWPTIGAPARFYLVREAEETVTEVVFGEATQDGLFVPLSPSYKYGISQYVIPAEVLQSGIDRNIEALQYRVLHNDDYGTARSVEIRLMEIPKDTVDSFVDVSEAVTVYSGEVYLPGEREDRTVQIDFDTPFTYNGGNLLVSFCDTTGNYVTFTWFDAFSREGGSVYHYTDQEELAFENLAAYKATQTSETPLTTVIFKGDVIPSEKYEVTLEQSGQGEATVFPMRASAGEEVSVNAVADVLYKVGSVYVEDENGEEIEVTDGTFVMPDGAVTVYVNFVPMELPVTYTVKMFDLAGNGWGGNALRIVKVDGETETELGVATLESGSEGSYEFIVESGEELRFYWVKGSNARHCTFSIFNGESEVHASGALTNDIEDGSLIHSMTAGYVFDINTVNGAQMRVAVGRPQGLRFVSHIGKTEGFHQAVSEYGTVLIPTESLDDGDINNLVIGKTMANGHEVCKVQAKTLYGEDEEEVVFTAVITNIAEKNYTRAYTARAYAILSDGSVVYGDTYTSRSIYQIAKLILEDEDASEAELTAAQAIVDVVEKYGDNDASDPWN